jgi:hypothetical protein
VLESAPVLVQTIADRIFWPRLLNGDISARSAASRLQAADIIGLYIKPGGSGQDLIVNGI